MSSFTLLGAPVESATDAKNSDFLTFLHPVASREEAMALIDTCKVKYSNANHVCWAYVIGNTRQPIAQAFSDDGEPSGTAGKPMLHVLTEREVGNCLAMVVRYFGGVKLGAGGLVRAYSAAVSTAVNGAQLLEVTPSIELLIDMDFAHEAKVRHLVSLYDGTILKVYYAAKVRTHISITAIQADAFTQQLLNETSGNAHIHNPNTKQSHTIT